MTYEEWAIRHPAAAAELAQLHAPTGDPVEHIGESEAATQARVRLKIAYYGAKSFRNNVGATPASVQNTCPKCKFHFRVNQQPVRYGLANDSAAMNKKIKSSDLILAIPRLITSAMVGSTIAQFGAAEIKPAGWEYRGRGREVAQLAFLTMVSQIGGYATFSTGDIQL